MVVFLYEKLAVFDVDQFLVDEVFDSDIHQAGGQHDRIELTDRMLITVRKQVEDSLTGIRYFGFRLFGRGAGLTDEYSHRDGDSNKFSKTA